SAGKTLARHEQCTIGVELTATAGGTFADSVSLRVFDGAANIDLASRIRAKVLGKVNFGDALDLPGRQFYATSNVAFEVDSSDNFRGGQSIRSKDISGSDDAAVGLKYTSADKRISYAHKGNNVTLTVIGNDQQLGDESITPGASWQTTSHPLSDSGTVILNFFSTDGASGRAQLDAFSFSASAPGPSGPNPSPGPNPGPTNPGPTNPGPPPAPSSSGGGGSSSLFLIALLAITVGLRKWRPNFQSAPPLSRRLPRLPLLATAIICLGSASPQAHANSVTNQDAPWESYPLAPVTGVERSGNKLRFRVLSNGCTSLDNLRVVVDEPDLETDAEAQEDTLWDKEYYVLLLLTRPDNCRKATEPLWFDFDIEPYNINSDNIVIINPLQQLPPR
ncbi:MAG: hypothetical protein OIF34_10085, partial [Porticoccaceae bacterium]|nr:hypothetical protein [Porticoccaceae bacterium]